jgi:hypothetical protein
MPEYKPRVRFQCFGTEERPHAIIFYLHDPHFDVDEQRHELKRLAEETHSLVYAYEYPGYGHLRRPPSPAEFPGYAEENTGQVAVSWTGLEADVLMAWDEMNGAKDSNITRVVVSCHLASALALHVVKERPSKVQLVVMQDPWTRWSDFFWSRLGKYWPAWLVEPCLFDSVATVGQINPEEFKGVVVVCYGKQNTITPPHQVAELVVTLLNQFPKRVEWRSEPRWNNDISLAHVFTAVVIPAVNKYADW